MTWSICITTGHRTKNSSSILKKMVLFIIVYNKELETLVITNAKRVAVFQTGLTLPASWPDLATFSLSAYKWLWPCLLSMLKAYPDSFLIIW